MEEEQWKYIEGYDEKYQISNMGRVKSISKYRYWTYIKPKIDKDGYVVFGFRDKTSKRKWLKIHRLVATYYILNPDNLPHVNHIDGNKQNNNVENLEWCTPSYNIQHLHKLRPELGERISGEGNPQSKLTSHEALDIFKSAWGGKCNYRAIAEKYNISIATVYDIKYGKCWSSVTGHNYNNKPRPNFNGELNPSAKLNNTQVLEIYELVQREEHSIKKIAIRYGVSTHTISRIKLGKSWSNITHCFELKNV